MTELAALSVLINGDASGLKAAIASSVGLVDRFAKDAEASAKVFERAFAADEKAVDRLRKAIDPLYASSKRYEAAVETLDKALRSGSLSQQQHADLLKKTNAAYLGAEPVITRHTGMLGALGNMSSGTKGKIQNLGYQVQDMAIQFQMGTSAATIFAQQGSQIASIFGPVGAIIGTLAAVGIPLLAAAFMTAEKEARKFSEVLAEITDKTAALKEAQSILKMNIIELYQEYGIYAQHVRDAAIALVELQAAEAQAQLAKTIMENTSALNQFGGAAQTVFSSGVTITQAMVNIRDQFGLTGQAATDLYRAFGELRNAVSFEDRLAALRQISSILDAAGVSAERIPPEVRQLMIEAQQATIASAELKRVLDTATSAAEALKAAAPGAGWLSGAISDAAALAGKLWEAADAAAQASGGKVDPGMRPRARPHGEAGYDWGAAPKKGGGGGKSAAEKEAKQAASELEALQQTLMTKEQLEFESYLRQQETLKTALEQKLLTQQEYNGLMEEVQKKHQDTMAGIDAYRYGTGLQKAQAFMGDMSQALSTGNDKMLKISRAFGAAQALISTWTGAAKALELPFPANMAAYAKVLATGLGAVSAIKSGSSSSGSSRGGSSSSGAAPAAVSPTQTLNFHLTNDPFGYGERFARSMVEQLNAAQRNGSSIRGTVTVS